MKGVVFTEFLEMVEERYSLELADRIIAASHLATDGAYTAVGTYDYRELLRLVEALSGETGTEARALVASFGRHLFGRFHALYPHFFEGIHEAFDFLVKVDRYIHVEVRKLHADAELPSFEHAHDGPDALALLYRSRRPLADLAEGLILGCVDHFAEGIDLAREDLPSEHGERTRARFTLTRRPS